MQKEEDSTRPFIGREKELSIFKEWLARLDTEEPEWILYFHDALEEREKKGGVGKTSLLNQCAKLTKKLYPDSVIVRIDFFNITDRNGTVISDRIVNALREANPQWDASHYLAYSKEYRDAIQAKKPEIEEMRENLTDILLSDLNTLREMWAENEKHLLLMFDTYEVIESNPSITALIASQSFPYDYGFRQKIGVVVAGRNELDWSQINWRGREQEVREVALAPFTEAEMLEYFESQSRVDPKLLEQHIHDLHALTQGRPILVGLVTDVLSQRVMRLEELVSTPHVVFESSLVAKINEFERPFDTILLHMAHAYHRFNFTLLDFILEGLNAKDTVAGIGHDKLEELLLSLSFVRRPSSVGNDFVLHDEMRPLITKYCWEKQDPDGRTRKEISTYVLKYYEEELEHTDQEQLRLAYIVEMLHHKLFLNVETGYKFFQEHFERAINLWLNVFARSLLQEVLKYSSQLTNVQQYMLKRYEAKLLQKEERGEDALKLYAELELEADRQWLEENQLDIIYEKGACCQQLSRYLDAVNYFKTAIEIANAQNRESYSASILNWLGATYVSLGELDTALEYFNECIDVHKRYGNQRAYASVLNSIGRVYRLQGKIEEALRKMKFALRIRSELFKQGRSSEVFVGWTLHDIGTIYLDIENLVQAGQYFQDAQDIFVRTGNKQGQAAVYNRFGQICSLQGELGEAQIWYEKAYLVSLGGVDSLAQISSLNRMGALFRQQQKFSEAEKVYQQALELAQQIHNYYQQSESAIGLVDVWEHIDHKEQARHLRQEAMEICQQYNYYYLLGQFQETMGDNYSEAENYREAFRYYGEACRYMALHNALVYNKILRKLIDKLMFMRGTEKTEILQNLITFWEEQGLEEEHADFIEACQDVRDLMEA